VGDVGRAVGVPDASFADGQGKRVQWDGQRVQCYGQYARRLPISSGSALVDYKQLRAKAPTRKICGGFYQLHPAWRTTGTR